MSETINSSYLCTDSSAAVRVRLMEGVVAGSCQLLDGLNRDWCSPSGREGSDRQIT